MKIKQCDYKAYGGRYVFGFGIPYVILTFWEGEGKYFSERFIIFHIGKKVLKAGDRISAEKAIFGSMEDFLNYEVLEQAKNKILHDIIFKERKSRETFWYSRLEIILESIDKVRLVFLKSKFPDEIKWVHDNTSCDKLIKDIEKWPFCSISYQSIE